MTSVSLAQLCESVDAAAKIEGVEQEGCARLAHKLRSRSFELVVAGQFKRGKSSLVNALIGAPLLPVGVVPLTSVVTILQFGERASAEVAFLDGSSREVALAELPEYVTERANPRNRKGVRQATLRYPSEWLRDGIRLVDTPGIGSVYEHNTEAALRYVPNADAVLFVASADQPMSHAEAEFLADLRRHAGKVFCLLNKADYLSEAELDEMLTFTTQAVRTALDASVPVIPVSARLALEGKTRGDMELVERSRFPAFDRALRRFLANEREQVWLDSARNGLLRLLEEARLRDALELKALAQPLSELEAKLARFAAKKQEAEHARADIALLVEGEARRLLKDRIEPDLEQFKRRLQDELAQRVASWLSELGAMPLRALRSELESRAIAEVRAACERWRTAEDTIVAEALRSMYGRHAEQVQRIADELLRYAADLFDIPYETVEAQAQWASEPQFSYKFWDEPGSLYLLASSLALALPRFIAEPLLRKRSLRGAVELVETQSGRMRYSFDERLKTSVADFRRDMLERIEATTAGIEAALERGASLRRGAEQASAGRSAALHRALERIEALAAPLASRAPAAAAAAVN
jgi:GTP-binding protein EngB required for normal cell division